MNALLPQITPDVNSYGMIIRDTYLARLKALPIFTASVQKWATTRFFIKQHVEFPFVGVYLLDENWLYETNWNAGAPHYVHMLRLGYSVVVVNNDPEASEHNLDQAHWAIMHLFDQPLWQQIAMPPPFDPILIEGVTRGSRSHWFGNAGLNNDLPVAELRMDQTFTYRSDWPPVIKDGFLRMDVTAALSWPYDPGAGDSVEFDFEIPQD